MQNDIKIKRWFQLVSYILGIYSNKEVVQTGFLHLWNRFKQRGGRDRFPTLEVDIQTQRWQGPVSYTLGHKESHCIS